MIRSRDDLINELQEQWGALRVSSESYDKGNLWEAKRLATIAYILFHDGGKNSRSLLGQLSLKNEVISTVDHTLEKELPLTVMTIRLEASPPDFTFMALLDVHSKVRQPLKFKNWYNEKVFQSGSLQLSRKNLIFTFRNQAGGAHVDGSIRDDAFNWLTTNSPYRLAFSDPVLGNAEMPDELRDQIDKIAALRGPVPNGHYATMRQIAWEIDLTLSQMSPYSA